MNYISTVLGSRYRILGLSVSKGGLNDYIMKYKVNYQVLTDLDQKSLLAYRLGGTPQLFLISEKGFIVRNWLGAFSKDVRADIEKQFAIRLPAI